MQERWGWQADFQMPRPTIYQLLGHPGRASGLMRFLDYVKSKSDVWVCKRLEIARHWLEHHPYKELA